MLASGGSQEGKTLGTRCRLRPGEPRTGRLQEDRPVRPLRRARPSAPCLLMVGDRRRQASAALLTRAHFLFLPGSPRPVRVSSPSVAPPCPALPRPARSAPPRRARRPRGRSLGRAPSQPQSQPAPRGPTRASPVTHLCRANSSQLSSSYTLTPQFEMAAAAAAAAGDSDSWGEQKFRPECGLWRPRSHACTNATRSLP